MIKDPRCCIAVNKLNEKDEDALFDGGDSYMDTFTEVD